MAFGGVFGIYLRVSEEICLLDEVINDNKGIPSVIMETDFINNEKGSNQLTWMKIDILKSS